VGAVSRGETSLVTRALASQTPSTTRRRATPAQRREAARNLLRAARLKKNLPLLLLVLAGALLAPPRLNWGLLCASLVLALISAAFMTHLNILTDVELDREKKPHLWRWLSTDPELMVGALGLELGIVVGGVAVLALFAPLLALGLALFTLLTVLYSYNFFRPASAVASRLKAHWLGHFAVCVGAYLSLWIVGYCSAGRPALASLGSWLPVFCSVSLSEYSLFLAESAIDADEERRYGLATAAHLLGRRGSSIAALGVWLAASSALAAYATFGLAAALRERVLIAFGPALLARGLTTLLLALELKRAEALRSTLPDAVFWGSRLLTALTLAVLFFH
jgi:4-hydroxybenzoate polyprenyltransferase